MGSDSGYSYLDGVQCPNCGGYKTEVSFEYATGNFFLALLSFFTLGLLDFERNLDWKNREKAAEQAKKAFWKDSKAAVCQICGYKFRKRDLRPVLPNVQLIQKAEEEEARRRRMWD